MAWLKKKSLQFLTWYCRPEYLEDIAGDLEELYDENRPFGVFKADWKYAMQIVVLCRRGIVRPFFRISKIRHDMIRNYLKIGWRSILRQRANSAIHILGLGLGLAAFLVINQYTAFEKSYDQLHIQDKRIVRLTTDNIVNGQIQVRDAMSFAPSGSVLTDEFAEIINYSTSHKFAPMIIRKGELMIEEQRCVAADPNFFEIFNYPFLLGDQTSALSEPYSIVLTESQALKYFGSLDVVGESIEVVSRFNRAFEITGIMPDLADNNHYKFDFLISLSSIQEQIENDEWNGFNYYTFLEIEPHTDLENLQARLLPLAYKYLSDETTLFFNLQPLEDIHLHSNYTYEPEVHGSAKAVRFLDIISIFILLIAWINYINLSTARAVDRAKEVGLRKVVGAAKRQLISQFLVEASLINVMSAAFALFLVWIAAPYFNQFVDKEVFTHIFENTDLLKKLFSFFVLGILTAGLYPALVLSSFKPLQVVQGKFKSSQLGHTLRKSLVVAQFGASLILVASTVIVYLQIKHMLNQDVGMEVNRVIGIKNFPVSREQLPQHELDHQTFLKELLMVPGVEAVGAMSSMPGGGSMEIGSRSAGLKVPGITDLVEGTIYVSFINDQVIPTLNMKLLAGRNFDRTMGTDTQAVVLNESLVRKLNIPDPELLVNQKIQFGRDPEAEKWTVIGIVKDFNRSSLKDPVEPTMLHYSISQQNTIARISADSPNHTIAKVALLWERIFPNAPFTFEFVDDRFAKLYAEDRRFGGLFANFAILAMIVASLGLLGLSSFLAAKRTKEIGIRKVLGASSAQIVVSFFKEYIVLIFIAALLGFPVVYIAMQGWLQGYAYHIHFPWWVLGASLIAITIVAFSTVGYQNFKVAQLNPSDAIRYE